MLLPPASPWLSCCCHCRRCIPPPGRQPVRCDRDCEHSGVASSFKLPRGPQNQPAACICLHWLHLLLLLSPLLQLLAVPHLDEVLREGAAVHDCLLCTTDLGSCHQLHGLCDLHGVLWRQKHSRAVGVEMLLQLLLLPLLLLQHRRGWMPLLAAVRRGQWPGPAELYLTFTEAMRSRTSFRPAVTCRQRTRRIHRSAIIVFSCCAHQAPCCECNVFSGLISSSFAPFLIAIGRCRNVEPTPATPSLSLPREA